MSSANTPEFHLIVKKDCPTCTHIEPVISRLDQEFQQRLKVYVQDDPAYPGEISNRVDDTSLEYSFRNDIEIVPTLIRLGNKDRVQRIEGWDKSAWRKLTGLTDLGDELSDFRPGCGSKSRDPGMDEVLSLRFGDIHFASRQVQAAGDEDLLEACYTRGWSDGLPVIPPTPIRVLRMLRGSDRAADEIIGRIPPNNPDCSIEKVAINAVLAGCQPEYFPVVLASVEAALQDRFCLHGLLCTTYFSSPVMIVNGPVTRRIGMNAGVNALGQGNRANATIGRALQLLVRNVGGGLPGGIDRAAMGNPGKYTYCFAEDESDPEWPSLAMDRGYQREESVISLFAGEGLQPIVDQLSRHPESLARSMARSLRSVAHYKRFGMSDAILVVGAEHRRVFRENGWSKSDLKQALYDDLMTPGAELLPDVDGVAEGMPERFRDKLLDKFRDDGLHIVTTGGTAGMFSAIISGWAASGEKGSQLVSQKIE